VRLQEKPDTAEFIIEGRVGVLANDGYEVTYGIPGNAAAVSATVLLSTPVPVPQPGFPELSLGRRNHQAGTAKIGLFAYDRVTREPVWQAGVKTASSNVRDTWVLGLGPYQSRPKRPRSWWKWLENPSPMADEPEVAAAPLAAYRSAIVFQRALAPPQSGTEVAAASAQQSIAPSAAPGTMPPPAGGGGLGAAPVAPLEAPTPAPGPPPGGSTWPSTSVPPPIPLAPRR
jgi:hypothetical protein